MPSSQLFEKFQTTLLWLGYLPRGHPWWLAAWPLVSGGRHLGASACAWVTVEHSQQEVLLWLLSFCKNIVLKEVSFHPLWLTLLPGAPCDPALLRLQPAAMCMRSSPELSPHRHHAFRRPGKWSKCTSPLSAVGHHWHFVVGIQNMGAGRRWSFLESWMPLWLWFPLIGWLTCRVYLLTKHLVVWWFILIGKLIGFNHCINNSLGTSVRGYLD